MLRLDSATSLEPIRLEDAASFHELVEENLAWLLPWMPFARDHSLAKSEAFVANAVADAERGNAFHFAARRGGSILGAVGVHHIDAANRIGQVGYWLSAPACGKGLATLAVRHLVGWAIEELHLNRIELRIEAGNSRSRALAERLGFAFEGRMSEALSVPDGFRDLDLFAMTERRWRNGAHANGGRLSRGDDAGAAGTADHERRA